MAAQSNKMERRMTVLVACFVDIGTSIESPLDIYQRGTGSSVEQSPIKLLCGHCARAREGDREK